MRVNKAIVVIAATALLAWGLGATKDPMKIGTVDLDQAVTATDKGKAARDEMDRKLREAQAKLQPLTESYETAVKELEAKRFILSEDALFQKQLDIQELRNQIETKQNEIKGQLEVDRERILAPLRNQLVAIVDEVGKEGGFSLILLRTTQGILYAREALDVTDLIIEKLNKKG